MNWGINNMNTKGLGETLWGVGLCVGGRDSVLKPWTFLHGKVSTEQGRVW